MNSMEKSMLLDELFALRKADKEREARLLEKLNRMTEQLMNLNESSQAQVKVIDGLKQMIASRDILIEKLQKENAALKEQKKQDRKNLYGSKSQKISRKKKEEVLSHEENKDDFDGTSGPLSVSASDKDALSQAPEKKEERPYRKGMSYKRMKADKSVCHDCIRSKLDVLLFPIHPPRVELMNKTVNYLQVFWKQLFAYLNDGRYDIDNSTAECFICLLAGEHKTRTRSSL